MTEETRSNSKQARGVSVLAYVNVGIWAITMIALVFVMQHSPAVKTLYPILAGGTAVGIALITASAKLR